MTLDVAKLSGTVGFVDKRDQKFTKSSKVTIDNWRTVGGGGERDFDMWSTGLKDQPMPITAEFCPLYELLTPARLPNYADTKSLQKKRSLLEKATKDWLATNGTDLRSKLLRYGDKVGIELVVPGPTRVISSDAGTYVRTVRRQGAGSPKTQQWVLDDPAAPGSTKEVEAGRDVVLRSGATGRLLDAQAGSDHASTAATGWPARLTIRGARSACAGKSKLPATPSALIWPTVTSSACGAGGSSRKAMTKGSFSVRQIAKTPDSVSSRSARSIRPEHSGRSVGFQRAGDCGNDKSLNGQLNLNGVPEHDKDRPNQVRLRTGRLVELGRCVSVGFRRMRGRKPTQFRVLCSLVQGALQYTTGSVQDTALYWDKVHAREHEPIEVGRKL